MNSEQQFGNWLKQRRLALDLTQEELARQVGCSAIAIRKIEAGERRPSKEIADLLAEELGVPVAERATFLLFARGTLPGGSPLFTTAGPTSTGTPTNVPAVLPESVGRENDVARLREWLQSPRTRLLTLVGPAGVGKTHLALQVAQAVLTDFPDGVFFVPLAAILDPTLLLITIAQIFDLSISRSHPQALLLQLKFFLRNRRLLLLLDNFEQLMPAAHDVADLASACPSAHILVTSRERLRLPGERPYPVRPLSPADATALFALRAQAAQPDFVLNEDNRPAVATLCSHLDGLPLAIELVAARTQLMSPQLLLSRLVDSAGRFNLELIADRSQNLPQRQHTLNQAIAWSYNLLDRNEQRILRRLAVFAGSFSLEAAEAVAGESEEAVNPAAALVQVWNMLASLIEKSLVEQKAPGETACFVLLETIREFAFGRLVESGELEAVRQRHLGYYTTLAETAESHLADAGQVQWLDRLELEAGNLRAALHNALETRSPNVDWGIRLATALRHFWDLRGHWLEGQRWLELALLHRYAAPPLLQARVLLEAGIFAEHREAGDLLRASLALYQQLADPWGMAQALNWLGRVAIIENEYQAAVACCQESLTLHWQLGNQMGAAEALFNLGLVAWRQGDDSQARALYEQSLAAAQAAGNKQQMMLIFRYLGIVAHRQGDEEQAHRYFTTCLSLAEQLADKNPMAAILSRLTNLGGTGGQAHEPYHKSLSLAETLGDRWFVNWIRHDLKQVQLNHSKREEGTWLGDSLAFFQRMGDQLGAAAYLIGLAGTARRPEQAAQLLGAADSLLTRLEGQLEAADQAEFDLIVATTRAQLDEATFRRAWESGRRMTPEQAIAIALTP
jgi:predicted ATPase/transcriptional regulator with XRE-family HTH domain